VAQYVDSARPGKDMARGPKGWRSIATTGRSWKAQRNGSSAEGAMVEVVVGDAVNESHHNAAPSALNELKIYPRPSGHGY